MRYEYLVLTCSTERPREYPEPEVGNSGMYFTECHLDKRASVWTKLGLDGWKLAACEHQPADVQYYFVRELPEPEPEMSKTSAIEV